MNTLPILLKDGYKVGHKFQYPVGTEYIYSNFTARKSRTGTNGVISYGLQYFLIEYLQRQFQHNFFEQPKNLVLARYKRRIESYLGPGAITYDHIAALHDLGFLPLMIKALPEGTFVPCGVPLFTIVNTHPEFFWLTNMLETLLSNILWKASTSATTAFIYRRRFEEYAKKTGGPRDFVLWQGHDFSFRGMSGIEDAGLSGSAHLLSFTGTDTIPAIDFLEEYYGANSDVELVGGSVPATEHSVMSMGTPEHEKDTYKRLLQNVYPSGIVSVVSDTWDFWGVLDNILTQPDVKAAVYARNGKLVIRPDSGDPVKIICGDPGGETETVRKGAIERLWDIFGGTTNARGFKELDSHIGLIYGDSITPERQLAILDGLARKGFASTNVVLGIGSYTYQYVTRDTYGFAMKATWGETKHGGGQAIFKDPVTDRDGGSQSKKSHRGLLEVVRDDNGDLVCLEDRTWEQSNGGLLAPVFFNGNLLVRHTLAEIRKRIEAQL